PSLALRTRHHRRPFPRPETIAISATSLPRERHRRITFSMARCLSLPLLYPGLGRHCGNRGLPRYAGRLQLGNLSGERGRISVGGWMGRSPSDDQGYLAADPVSRPFGQFLQWPAAHLLVPLRELPAHRCGAFCAEGVTQRCQGGRQPVRRFEEDQGPRLARQLAQAGSPLATPTREEPPGTEAGDA